MGDEWIQVLVSAIRVLDNHAERTDRLSAGSPTRPSHRRSSSMLRQIRLVRLQEVSQHSSWKRDGRVSKLASLWTSLA